MATKGEIRSMIDRTKKSKENKLTVGEQIKKRREEKDLTRLELAPRIGRTPEYLSYIENDKRLPRKFERGLIEKELDFKIID